MLVFCAHGIMVLHIRKCMHDAIAFRSLYNFAHILFVLAKQLLVFHLVYNVLLMLQCTYKFKHITQNNMLHVI